MSSSLLLMCSPLVSLSSEAVHTHPDPIHSSTNHTCRYRGDNRGDNQCISFPAGARFVDFQLVGGGGGGGDIKANNGGGGGGGAGFVCRTSIMLTAAAPRISVVISGGGGNNPT